MLIVGVCVGVKYILFMGAWGSLCSVGVCVGVITCSVRVCGSSCVVWVSLWELTHTLRGVCG
jgi:hypothetical protein